MLTTKQEKFAQSIVKGMSQRDSYKNAYNTENMSENAIDREASLLIKNPKVSQRIRELGSETEKETIMTAQERLEYLTGIIQGGIKEQVYVIVDGESVGYERPAELNTKLKAIDIMNKMQGEYVTKNINMNAEKLEDLL